MLNAPNPHRARYHKLTQFSTPEEAQRVADTYRLGAGEPRNNAQAAYWQSVADNATYQK